MPIFGEKSVKTCLGVVLVVSALLLFWQNQHEIGQAKKNTDRILQELLQKIPKEQEDDTVVYREMKKVVIEGDEYIGYLSIPSLDRKLPVMAQWNYDWERSIPGRYSGSLYTDDFVIAGYRYVHHFGGVGPLNIGTEVDFTDMENHTRHYCVTAVEVLQPDADVESAMSSGTWDMILLASVSEGETQYAVRCVLESCCDEKNSQTAIFE